MWITHSHCPVYTALTEYLATGNVLTFKFWPVRVVRHRPEFSSGVSLQRYWDWMQYDHPIDYPYQIARATPEARRAISQAGQQPVPVGNQNLSSAMVKFDVRLLRYLNREDFRMSVSGML